jgi:alkylation response protein AidB-like acyl-CoA dehydrogenase
LASATALLEWAVASESPGAFPFRCAVARVRVVSGCAEAVSDCLQVLGGYGYMEDYGLEKRLRDALVLDGIGGGRDAITLFLGRAVEDGVVAASPAAPVEVAS